MDNLSKKWIKIGIFLLLLAWFGFLMAGKIDLTTADLGRHIKNGEWLVENHFDLSSHASPIHENFFSYTYPDYPFVNHHWASGLVFYHIWSALGFKGLSIAYILLSVLTLAIFFFLAWRGSSFHYAALFSLLLIPLAAERREIRPEGFSAFFAGMFFLILWLWSGKRISSRWLLVLPILMILWVNLHVYFFLGLFLIGVFFIAAAGKLVLSRLDDRDFQETLTKAKWLLGIGFLAGLAALANPAGLKGAIHPFKIYANYGYTVLEEKSVWFLENYGIANPNFLTLEVSLIFLAIGLLLLFFINRKRFSFENLAVSVFFGAIGFLALRNFSLIGLFALPILSWTYFAVFQQKKGEMNIAKENGAGVLFVLIAILAIYGNWQFVSVHKKDFGIGLRPGTQEAAEFLRDKKISGPIFNNYDIGGYLIFYLPPEEKVFVDNRPEVYPSSFFSQIYKPMQENPDIFRQVDEKYGFKAIVFYRGDITPWAQSFFENINNNDDWSPVFKNNYAIIYLKKNETNQPIIEKYQLK
ncbi:MAG TPA: hypothetical protein VK254_03720 [Candidatus Bathyarchaeia archaeon]|nr:hypothetical protein [Candidatus Bathyarchaeia archaeon]